MATLQSGKCFTVPTFFGMCCRSEWQERMYIYKWHEVDQTKHEIFCVHIVCNEIQIKVNLEITTFFFYLRFPYCPNFFWFGVVDVTGFTLIPAKNPALSLDADCKLEEFNRKVDTLQENCQSNQTFYIYAFSRRFYPKRLTLHSGYTCFITMCVPWESNPQPFALLTQCSTTEPQEPDCHEDHADWAKR